MFLGIGNTLAKRPATKRLVSGSWLTMSSWTTTTGSSGWNGFTLRIVVDPSIVLPTSKLRLTVQSTPQPGSGVILADMFVGKSTAGDIYDFSATPTRVTFNAGSNGLVLANNASIVSDEINIGLLDTDRLVISAYFNGASDVASKAVQTGWRSFYKNANDAATLDATGYLESSNALLVSKIEYFA